MSHPGRWALALAMLVLVPGLVAPASAQSGLVCTASAAVTPTLRHEGFTEQTGDILLICSGAPGSVPTPPGVPIPQVDVSVSLSAPVTSRILGGASPQLLTDALLLVDDPSPANQDPCLSPTDPAAACQVVGDGGQTFNKPGKFNVFEGLGGSGAPSPNSVTFLGVPVDPPAATRTYRITNIRIDATAVPPGTAGLSPVFAYVSASPVTSIEIVNPQSYVGFVSNGLTATTSAANPPFLQCQTYPTTQVGTATFTENFATAFKVGTNGVQNHPGYVYYSESGLEMSLGGFPAGYADTGTRLQTVISNIPSGVIIYTDNWAMSSASLCPEVCSDATLVTGSGTPVDPGKNTITQVTGGTESSVLVEWEVTNTNTSAIESLSFNIYASFTSMPAANQPVGALSGFSPQLAAYSSSGPIPEFSSTVNVPVSPTNLFTISPCPAISGQVTLSGSGLSGVAMALSGSQSGAATTNSSGDYSFAVPAGGNYTITPSRTGYAFTPPSRAFNNLSGSQTGNFIAEPSTPKLKTLYNFTGGSGGAYPYGGVVIGSGGALYGTTAVDGASNHGTVFSLTPPTGVPSGPGGAWTETVLSSFTGGSAGSDPQAGVVIGKGGVLYGSASGTVFSLTPPTSPGGAWTETVLYRFTGGSGAHPNGGVVIGSGGVLYGTTAVGGASKLGTVFSLTPPTGVPSGPGGAWTETVLYSFTGGSGAYPNGGVVIGSGGILYGATYYGGTSNLGTVFNLRPPTSPGGSWTKRVLHNFTGAASDGAYPFASVVIGNGGVLYGTTVGGGSSSSCSTGSVPGCGTVFSLAPPAGGPSGPGGVWTETVLYSFTGGGDGSDPQAGLVIGTGGALYGTTAGGGASNDGTVFAVIP